MRDRRNDQPKRGHFATHSFSNECSRCGEDMDYAHEMTKTRRGEWIHKRCAGGGDEEMRDRRKKL